MAYKVICNTQNHYEETVETRKLAKQKKDQHELAYKGHEVKVYTITSYYELKYFPRKKVLFSSLEEANDFISQIKTKKFELKHVSLINWK
jgi:hypothetical protein